MYYEDEELPHLSATPGGGTIYIDEGTFDDWYDYKFPIHARQQEKAMRQIDEMYSMIKVLIEQNLQLQKRVKVLESKEGHGNE